MSLKLRSILFFTALVLVFQGCSYRPLGKTGLLSELNAISIPVVVNKESRADAEGVMTQALKNEFVRYIAVTGEDKADAILYGVIEEYETRPSAYTLERVVAEYRLSVNMSFKLISAATGDLIWSDKVVRDYEDYPVDEANALNTVEAEREALRVLAAKISREVFYRMAITQAEGDKEK